MKRLLLVFAVMLLSCPTLRAQGGGYRTERAIAYRDAADPASADSLCRLDLYYPTDRPGFATVIWFHGGGLTAGRREIPAALCNQGFAVAGVDYRLVPHVKVSQCVEDAAAAAAWVVRHIADYGGDPRLIFVAGHSAGGYLTSMIGLDKRWLQPYGPDPLQRAGGDAFCAAGRAGASGHAAAGRRPGSAEPRAGGLPSDAAAFGRPRAGDAGPL